MDAILVYIDDVLGSTFRRGLREEEQLGYALLCLHGAKAEHEGLSRDDFALAALSELGKRWFQRPPGSTETRGARILAKFVERDGRLFNERVLAEVDKFRASAEKRREVASAGAEARWGKARGNAPSITKRDARGNAQRKAGSMLEASSKHLPSIAEPMLSTCQPKPNPKEKENNLLSASLRESFDWLEAHYPNKVSVQLALQTWLSLADRGTIADADISAIKAGLQRWKESESWAQEGGKYIPGLARWIADQRWKDDPKPSAEALANRRARQQRVSEPDWMQELGRELAEEYRAAKAPLRDAQTPTASADGDALEPPLDVPEHPVELEDVTPTEAPDVPEWLTGIPAMSEADMESLASGDGRIG